MPLADEKWCPVVGFKGKYEVSDCGRVRSPRAGKLLAKRLCNSAELHGRRWLVTERCREYLIAAAQRFRGAPGFETSMVSTYA